MPRVARLDESQQVFTQLPRVLVEALDRRAERQGSSRSALVRDAVASYVADEIDDERARRDRAGYTAQPEEAPSGEGDARHAAARLLQADDLPW